MLWESAVGKFNSRLTGYLCIGKDWGKQVGAQSEGENGQIEHEIYTFCTTIILRGKNLNFDKKIRILNKPT